MSPDEGIDAPPLTQLHPVNDVGVIVEHATSGHRWEWMGKAWVKITPDRPKAKAAQSGAPPLTPEALNARLAACGWTLPVQHGATFTLWDDGNPHGNVYLVCPGGTMVPFGSCEGDIDEQRVRFIMDACNAVLGAKPAQSGAAAASPPEGFDELAPEGVDPKQYAEFMRGCREFGASVGEHLRIRIEAEQRRAAAPPTPEEQPTVLLVKPHQAEAARKLAGWPDSSPAPEGIVAEACGETMRGTRHAPEGKAADLAATLQRAGAIAQGAVDHEALRAAKADSMATGEGIDAGWLATWQRLPEEEQVVELAVLSGGDAPYVYRAFGCRTDPGDGWVWALATYGIPDHPKECEADDDYDVIAWRTPTSLPEAPAVRRFKVLRDRGEDGQEEVAIVTGRDVAHAKMQEIGLAARCEELPPIVAATDVDDAPDLRDTEPLPPPSWMGA
jgi:hypothetical protein